MRRFPVLGTVIGRTADAVQAIDIVHIVQIFLCKGALAVVGKNSVVLSGKIGIAGAGAPDRPDPLQAVIVLDQGHIAVHFPLHRHLIDHSGPVDAVLGQGLLIVAHHHRQRTAVSDGHIHHFPGEIAPDLSIHLNALHRLLWFCLRRLRFRLSLQDHHPGRFSLCLCRRGHRCLLIFLSAPGKSGRKNGCRQHHDPLSAMPSHLL